MRKSSSAHAAYAHVYCMTPPLHRNVFHESMAHLVDGILRFPKVYGWWRKGKFGVPTRQNIPENRLPVHKTKSGNLIHCPWFTHECCTHGQCPGPCLIFWKFAYLRAGLGYDVECCWGNCGHCHSWIHEPNPMYVNCKIMYKIGRAHV